MHGWAEQSIAAAAQPLAPASNLTRCKNIQRSTIACVVVWWGGGRLLPGPKLQAALWERILLQPWYISAMSTWYSTGITWHSTGIYRQRSIVSG
jgi:hypothetical protein